jgi:hypothetical protein
MYYYSSPILSHCVLFNDQADLVGSCSDASASPLLPLLDCLPLIISSPLHRNPKLSHGYNFRKTVLAVLLLPILLTLAIHISMVSILNQGKTRKHRGKMSISTAE